MAEITHPFKTLEKLTGKAFFPSALEPPYFYLLALANPTRLSLSQNSEFRYSTSERVSIMLSQPSDDHVICWQPREVRPSASPFHSLGD